MTAPQQAWGATQQPQAQQFQQQPYPQPQSAPAPSGADPFVPIPVMGGGGPLARHLVGRVVIIRPIRVDETTQNFNKTGLAPTVIADIIVVDGGDLVYGDQVNNAGVQLKPPTHRVQTPALFRGWMDSHTYIVNPLRDILRAGQPVTVGIIERGTQGNQPYFLTETHQDVNRNPRPAGHEIRRQLAIDLYNAFQTGQWSPPSPLELNPTPVAQAAPQGFAWQGQQAAPPTQVAPAPWAAPGNPQSYAQAPSTPPAAPAGQPMLDLSKPVPGLEQVWHQANEDQKRQAWTLHLQQNQQAPAAPSAPAPAATPWG